MFHNKSVKRKLPFLASLVLIIVLILTLPSQVFARRQRVLGASTVQIPPTVEGPGLILPDSPLFFLDELKQSVRVFLSFTPEAKAQVHASIAGERLAELRFMLAKNNKKGIETDLSGIGDNLSESAKNISQAKLTGRDVSVLAKKINDNIKSKQQTLDLLEAQLFGEMEKRVQATSEELADAKVEVEDSLPSNQLDNEIRDDINRVAVHEVQDASESAQNIKEDLDELQSQTKEAAQRSLKNREEALKKAIEEKNEALQKTQEKLLANELKKQDSLLKVQGVAATQAQEAVASAQKAAEGFLQAQKTADQLRNN